MKLHDVINRFALISGLSPEEISKWTPVCIDAMEEIRLMAKPSALKNEKEALRLSNLAGVRAYYKYTLYSAGEVKSFTAGSVSIVNFDDKAKQAKELWENEREALAELMEGSDGFCFRRVRV